MVSSLIDANPDRFAALYYHVGESGAGAPLNTTFGSQRSAFYPGTTIPALWFDGRTLSQSSGAFAGILQTRLNDPTDVTIDLEAHLQTVDSYQVNADVCIEVGGAGKTMRVYMAQAVDHFNNEVLKYYHRNTLRQGLAVEDVTLTQGECTQVRHTFTFSAASMAQEDDILVTVWAQDVASSGPADVHQAAQLNWPLLDPNFSFTPPRPGVGETVNFTDETVANGPIIQGYAWDFGDGDTSTLQNPTHGFGAAGCFDVTLEVTADVMTRSVTKGVPIALTAPTADYSHLPDVPDVGETVQFTDMSTGDFDSWSWDFGDGETSTLQNPTHVFSTKGNHDVTLTVSNGCDSDEYTVQIFVCETVPPVANFNHSPDPAHVGQNIFFSDISTPSGEILSWDWDFDDGTTSTARNVFKSFNAPGTYNVSLTVSSGCLEDTYTDAAHICQDPTAAFSTSPALPAIGEPVQFTDESTGGVVAWDWDFGDGASSTLQNPTHAYATGGTFTVTLTVTEALGCSGETTGTVDIGVSHDIFADGFEGGDTSAWSITVQ